MALNCIAGLDIGHKEIKLTLCEVDENHDVNVLSSSSSVTSGLEKGKIVDQDALTGAIKSAIMRAKKNNKFEIRSIISTLPLFMAKFSTNSGFIHLNDTEEIEQSHVDSCIKRAKNIVQNPDIMAAHILPIEYRINGEIVDDPVGKKGQNLEVLCHFVFSSKSELQTLMSILKTLNLTVNGIIYGPIATAKTIFNDIELNEGAGLIDIGKNFTKVSYFKKGTLIRGTIIPIGTETYIKDLSLVLKIPTSKAVDYLSENKTPPLPLANDIIHARHAELSSFIKKAFNGCDPLDTKIALVGGGIHIKKIRHHLAKQLDINTFHKMPQNILSILPSEKYVTSVGLILKGLSSNCIESHHSGTTLKTKVLKWFLDFF
ncbi:hypothetical protein HOG98_04990 [bacterium]|jgi:cell division protein FtsA|nr:hypothetical protein [bacterium]